MSLSEKKVSLAQPDSPVKAELELTDEQRKFLAEVIRISGQNVNLCYQCKKCTAGCPVVHTGAMDITPAQVIHAIRLGQVDLVLNSHTVWVCASCETCTTRCPQGVDIARVIDAARVYAQRLGRVDKEKSVYVFLSTFMNNLEKYGRLYELGLVIGLKLKTKEFLKDVTLGRDMFFKGKLKLLPHKMRNVKEIRQMLKNIKESEKK